MKIYIMIVSTNYLLIKASKTLLKLILKITHGNIKDLKDHHQE